MNGKPCRLSFSPPALQTAGTEIRGMPTSKPITAQIPWHLAIKPVVVTCTRVT